MIPVYETCLIHAVTKQLLCKQIMWSVTPVYYTTGKLHQITEKLLKVIKSLGFGASFTGLFWIILARESVLCEWLKKKSNVVFLGSS